MGETGAETNEREREQTSVDPAEDSPVAIPQMPLGIVVARILIVSGMSFAAAIAIFLLVGGLWQIALAALAATAFFLVLMFAVERAAER